MSEPKEPSMEKIVESELPEPLTSSEKHTFEARIAELESENAELRAKLSEPDKNESTEKTDDVFSFDQFIPELW